MQIQWSNSNLSPINNKAHNKKAFCIWNKKKKKKSLGPLKQLTMKTLIANDQIYAVYFEAGKMR